MVFPVREHALKVFTKLFDLLPETECNKTQVLVLHGGQTPYRNDTDRELLFRQESNFYYLTGCDVPDAHLVIVSARGTDLQSHPLIRLFVPPQDPQLLMWSPPTPTVTEAARAYTPGHVSIQTTPELLSSLLETLKAYPDALIHTLPPHPAPFPERPAGFAETYANKATHTYLLSALHIARLIKTPQEIELIRTANDISSRAHEVVMRLLGKGVRGLIHREKGGKPTLPGEWLIQKEAEAEAVFVASCRREGSIHQAYLPIVAGATRAATLHYCCNDKEFAWGPIGNGHAHDQELAHDEARNLAPQVLLIDAGAEWKNYASDITRTMPVGNGGKFTPEAREIYSLVLEIQNESIKILKPSLHWDAVHLLCHRLLVKGFLRLGIFKGSEEEILASGVSVAFFPHGVGHSLGLDVHDVPSASKPLQDGMPIQSDIARQTNSKFYDYLRLRLPLEAGMVVTVEPGCYFSPHLLAPVRNSPYIDHEVLRRYEPVGGVRIEDVIAITPDGYDLLTTVGKDVEWVEAVCSGNL